MNIKNYSLIKEENITEINGTAYLLEHDRTKARVLYVKNDDKNKVFYIGFRTPPTNDTGVAHITEHSVLCGSAKFPAKDPFVELAKGSLNTFLNAMTYPDKTVYPIASVNDKDYHNLMEVYLDAVFNPNTYKNEKILKQEGWHYHLENAEDELTYNGVVYNEMKGAYSSPEQMLMQEIQRSLFPDNTYGADSGGDPVSIPDLTYEEFLDFHRKYYHPSNCYIYLYGDVDVCKELAFIDEEYLSKYDYLEVDSKIKEQAAFDSAKDICVEYPLSDADSEEDNTYLSYNVVVGNSIDRKLDLAFTVLDYALIDVPGAPIKKALVDAGISNDVFSSYEESVRQPMYSIVAKGCDKDAKSKFVDVINETLSDIIKNGFDEKVLKGAINHFEFKLKEANYGRYPKGLMYGLNVFNSWLYDDNSPFNYLKYNEEIEFLKSQIGTDYYTSLINEYLLNNTHKTIVRCVPKKGLNQKNEKLVADKLKAYKESLTREEIDKLVAETKELLAYQAEPSTKEELEKIPMLKREDIGREAFKVRNREFDINGIKVVQQEIPTNGIAYVGYHFMLDRVPLALLPYVVLLSNIYKEVDTDKRSYGELANEIDIISGGIGFSTNVMGTLNDEKGYKVYFAAKTKTLITNLPETLSLMEEIMFESDITNKKRLKEIIAEISSQMKMSITESGHVAMAGRVMSYVSKGAYLKEIMEGIGFYEFIEALNRNFDESYEGICRNLKAALHVLAKPDNLIISYTGTEDIRLVLETALDKLKVRLNNDTSDEGDQNIEIIVKNEGFKTAGKVQYAAMGGDYRKSGFDYTGALSVLQVIFSYDYLWLNVRVSGGAYGCMCSFNRTGESYFTSYRDPNLSRTYEVYKGAAEYVKNFEVSDRDMLKYIIGAVAKLDMPMTPSAEGSYCFTCYLLGIDNEQLQKDRDEILSCDVEAIKALAPYIEAIINENKIAALGNEDVISKEAELFKEVRTLA